MRADDEVRLARNRAVDRARRNRNTLARLRGIPTGPVDAAPIHNRVRALTALGWSHEAIVSAARVAGTAAALRDAQKRGAAKAERKFQPIARLPLTYAVPPTVRDNAWVPSEGAVRRIRALLALGWRHGDIQPLVTVRVERLARRDAPRMRAKDWRSVSDAYERLSGRPGPSERVRSRAAKLGYFAPLAWDDVDDPTERPAIRPERSNYPAEELVAEWDHLRRSGLTMDAAAERLGVTRKAIEKAIERASGRAA